MRIYEPKSTPEQLTKNGIGKIICEYAIVHEEINGEYSLTFKVAQSSEHLESVIIGAIVKADTPKGKQFFRCSKPVTTLDGGKEVFAWHLSYDLAQDIILNRAWTGKTGAEALPEILQAGISETRFTGTSDISLVTNMRIVRTSVLGAIIGEQENSFVNRWGGEIERDNFTINVLSRLGADKGVTVRYRKNLIGLMLEEDDNEIANRIIPTGLNENDTVIMLPEVYIDSDNIDDTPVSHVRHVHFSDVKVGKEDEDDNIPYPTVASVQTELRARVAEMYAQGVDLLLKSAKVEFIDLSQTEEYKNYKQLESVNIGDTVTCIYRDINLFQRVVSYDYDALSKKYINIVLGVMVPTLGDSLWAQDLDLSALKNEVATTVKQNEPYNNVVINHTDGVVTSAVIDGKTITVKQNAQEGFAIYDGSTFIGGVKVEGGKVLLKGNAVETSAVISGKTITIKQDPAVGLGIYDGSTFIGGIKVIDSQVVLVSNLLTNDIDGDCYAVIGTDGSQKGITVYHKGITASVPSLKIFVASVSSGDTVLGSQCYIQTYNGTQIRFGRSDTAQLSILDRNSVARINTNSIFTEIISPNGNYVLGADDSGVYKKISGSRTNL